VAKDFEVEDKDEDKTSSAAREKATFSHLRVIYDQDEEVGVPNETANVCATTRSSHGARNPPARSPRRRRANQPPVHHYGESPYETCLYGDFLNLYYDGQANSILTTGITAPSLPILRSDMDPNVTGRLLRP
jgi:hypothetical protein